MLYPRTMPIVSLLYLRRLVCFSKEDHTENSAAPWIAVSTTCIVALSPGFTVTFAGNGT